jgi:F-type H+-transporting ATPase subunit b
MNGSLDPSLDGCYAPTLLCSSVLLEEISVIVLALAGGAIQLVPDGTLLFHLVLIVVMVSLLNATLLKPINRILAERERRTKGSSAEAQRVLESVHDKMREYQQQLREARTKGYSLLDEKRRAGSRERELKVTGVKGEVARWIDQEKQAVKRDEELARSSLMKDAEARAFEIAARILGRSANSGS